MVRHIVMFKFLPEANGKTAKENALTVKEMLEALPAIIPCIVWSKVTLNDGTPANYDLVLESDFKSYEDLKFYAEHPDHVKVGAFMKDIREARACVDYEY